MTSKSWYRVPLRVLQDRKLSASDVGVLAIICDKADGESCKLSASEIAKELEVSVSTVKRAFKKLSDSKYISIEHQKGGASEFRQLVLEPKRRGYKKRSEVQVSKDADFDVSKYEQFINRFEEAE